MLDINQQNYQGADNLLNLLRESEFVNVPKATIYLLSSKILQGKYEEAYQILLSINPDALEFIYQKYYEYFKMFLDIKFNHPVSYSKDFISAKYLLGSKEKEIESELLDNLNNKLSDCAFGVPFLNNLDFKKVIKTAQECINDLNGIHERHTTFYRFNMPFAVGDTLDEEKNTGIAVKTMLGTKNIVDLYPIELSDDFDKEGLSRTRKLK